MNDQTTNAPSALPKSRIDPITGLVHVCTVRSDDGWEAMCCLWDGERWLYWDSELEPHGWEPVTDMNCVVEDWDLPIMPSPGGSLSDVLHDVRAERWRQDNKWGGQEHDDKHAPEDWERYIMQRIPVESKDDSEFRKRMVQIAALAVAAIQSFDRRSSSPFEITPPAAGKKRGGR